MNFLNIESNGYKAKISTSGSSLIELTKFDVPLIESPGETFRFHGAVLAPWPNRVANGEYSFDGDFFKIEINEKARNTSLHGLVYKSDWEVKVHSTNTLQLEYILKKSSSFPTSLLFQSSFELGVFGLKWTITATNIGEVAAPYGISIHPYLVPGEEVSVSEFYLTLPSSEYLEVDPKRLLPIEIRKVFENNFDFRKESKIGNRIIDHAFKIDPKLSPVITVKDKDGFGTSMTFCSNAKWVQIHTADREGGSDSRKSIAIEPMTCPPDAFNSKIDLKILQPNEKFSTFWNLSRISDVSAHNNY